VEHEKIRSDRNKKRDRLGTIHQIKRRREEKHLGNGEVKGG